MAKSNQKGNREIRKPKSAKGKSIAPASATSRAQSTGLPKKVAVGKRNG